MGNHVIPVIKTDKISGLRHGQCVNCTAVWIENDEFFNKYCPNSEQEKTKQRILKQYLNR